MPGYKNFKTNCINLLYLKDGGVCKIVDDGEVVIITSQERRILNEKGENLPNDIDYWL
jgi:hypothetical protein